MDNKVNRTIELLYRDPTSYQSSDRELLTDLKTQLILYLTNFEVEETLQDSTEQNRLTHSINYLSSLLATSNNNNASSTSNTHTPNGFRIEEANGKRIYFLNDKQIRFKVLKNKPKNGEFKVRWNRSLEALKEFKERFGHLQVTRSTEGHEELGNWVAEQRRKLKRGKITFEQFEALNEIGFEWDRSYYFHKTFQDKKKRKL